MKILSLKQLLTILAKSPKAQRDFKEKQKFSEPVLHLYSLLSVPVHAITEPRAVYKFVFGEEDYNKSKLSLLKNHLRETLSDFLKLRNFEKSAQGQNINAQFYEKHGHNGKATEANRAAIKRSAKEAENKRWLANFEAYNALYFRGERKQAEKAQHSLLLFFLFSFQKLSIEQLTIFRIQNNKTPLDEAKRQHIANVLKLLPTPIPPIINIQTKAIRYYERPCFELYKAFKTTFFNQMKSTNSDRKYFLNSLLNAIALYPNPSEKIIQEYLPLYRFSLENILFNEGELEIKLVCNVLGVADSLGDYELTKLAQEKLIPLLTNEKEKNWCEKLAEISIFHGEKELSKAMDKITELNQENVRCFDVTLRKNLLKLKCSYDISTSRADAYGSISEASHNFDKLLTRNFKNKNTSYSTYSCSNNFIEFLMMICNTKKYTKTYLREKLVSYKGEIMETKWLKEKITILPIWDYLHGFKKDYDSAWNKYEALVRIQKKESAFRKMLSRYRQKGYIHEKHNKSLLNFFNLLVRICDERNPLNAKRHLVKKLESYGEFMMEKDWILEKLKKFRP